MGFWDKLMGREQPQQPQYGNQPRQGYNAPNQQPNQPMTDEQAVARYRYMLQTAPPETIEQAHAEAFAQLTPEQRRMVLTNLSAVVPPNERATSDDPQSLARMATRAEIRQPGTMERTFGSTGGVGLGGMMAGSFFSSIAGVMVGTMIAQSFFGGFNNDGSYSEGYQDGQQADNASTDSADSADSGGDYDNGDYGSSDFGGNDFGGGDFGGGDFGGDF